VLWIALSPTRKVVAAGELELAPELPAESQP
jgi:hypothetical protein